MPRPSAVAVTRASVTLPTYLPDAPDRNPMFLEKRVYQGSSGRVYPLPFFNRIAEQPVPHDWKVVFLENEYLRVMVLPELGGRIHRIVDKTNNYDAIYYQPVIKPALVGLGGPWVSGGIEFNWPQHHRPATFMPTDVEIETHDDGSMTAWLSEHDPMARMKGMHGVCLHPGRSVIELKVRAYNRTADTQTFLWWANVATRVHEHYQSFFPPDATFVADHAKRAMATYPHVTGRYYGIDYGERARHGVPPDERPRLYPPRAECAPDDISWYANIPVPTSYMCMGSQEDFVGGYDHRAEAGILHLADHRIAPGKKQWTWGNHEFGYAWDRNLTDATPDGEYPPYIELMAGVFTDNQPDFSFIAPGETRTWSQFWYPYRAIGIVHHANTEVALSLRVANGHANVGVAVTRERPGTVIRLLRRGREIARVNRDLAPGKPARDEFALPPRAAATDLTVLVDAADGRELIRYTPKPPKRPLTDELARLAATEPPPPAAVSSTDELYLIGVHLEQYRHATRMPETYWREALRRDPGDSRCRTVLGRWHLRRGEWDAAERNLRAAVQRLTARNPNPADGEAYYQLGRCLRLQAWSCAKGEGREGKLAAARDAFAKAAWNNAWQAPSHHALAELAAQRGDWADSLAESERSLRLNTDNLRARNLQVIVLRRLGREADAAAVLAGTRRLDPLDWWSRHLAGLPLTDDAQVRLDVALDAAQAGLFTEALEILEGCAPSPVSGAAPLINYYRAWLRHQEGDDTGAARDLARAQRAPLDYCFPARLEEILILEWALATVPDDAVAAYLLGNLLYDRRRHREAITCWRCAVRHDPRNALAWRNLGIGAFNVLGQSNLARRAYARARALQPEDARLLYEQDQLAKRTGIAPMQRLRVLEKAGSLVRQRDDLSVEWCALCNQTGQPERAQAVLGSRRFQPWEGGEGQALGQFVRTQLLLGRAALGRGDAATARRELERALHPPENLGEVRHLLANQSDVWFWLGEACAAAGDMRSARAYWNKAARFHGDFQEMSVRAFSEMTYYSALSWQRLGQATRAHGLLRSLLNEARTLERSQAKIDYFATSLPTMLLFNDDLTERQRVKARFMAAQAWLGLGKSAIARRLLRQVIDRDPAHAPAVDLLGSLRRTGKRPSERGRARKTRSAKVY